MVTPEELKAQQEKAAAKLETKHPSDVAIEGGWQATLDYLKQRQANDRAALATADILLEGHPALTPELGQAQAARKKETEQELDALAQELIAKFEAEMLIKPQAAEGANDSAAQTALVENAENEVQAKPEAAELKPESAREKDGAALAQHMGNLGMSILEHEGALNEATKEELVALSDKIFDFYQAEPDEAAHNLQRMWARFNESVYHTENLAGRIAGLKVFFEDYPALAGKIIPETKIDLAPEAKTEVLPQKPLDAERLLDLDATAFKLAPAMVPEFFAADDGARSKLAFQNLDKSIQARQAKIDELLKQRPQGKDEMAGLRRQVEALERANKVAKLRKEQWDKQKELYTSDMRLAELAAEKEKIQKEMQHLSPGEYKTKEALSIQYEHQDTESEQQKLWHGKLEADITNLDLAIDKERSVQKVAESERAPDVSGTGSDVIGDWLPEKGLEKGMAQAGEVAEKAITKATDAVAGLMGGNV